MIRTHSGTKLTESARVVYKVLEHEKDTSTDCCQASYRRLIERSGYSRQQVIRAIRELTDKCWIYKVVRRDKTSGGNLINEYYLKKVSPPSNHEEEPAWRGDWAWWYEVDSA